MALIGKIALAIVVGVIVFLVCILVGGLLADLQVSFARTVGGWLRDYAAIFGLAAALWYFFAGSGLSWPNRSSPS